MKAGPLDRTVTIERAITVSDDYGGDETTWVPIVTVCAQVQQMSGREFFTEATTLAERKVVFRLRWMDGLTVVDRVLYDGRAHNIQDVKELGRREGLELQTVAAG